MRAVFWVVVILWWSIDFYVLVLKKNGYHKILERKSKFIITFLIFLGIILALIPSDFRESWKTREFGIFQVIGTIILAIGVVIRFLSIMTLGRHFTPDIGIVEDKKLVTNGLYSKIRHPSYTGEIVAFLGLALVFQHIPSSIFVFVFPAIAFVYRAFLEEKKLIEEFGEEYLQYRKRTRMFI
ncbi:MAG: isoprenylcysteine carboxylmethyltransferase family protein [Fervidobacterium sp.]|nr:isoprenylcysteine carboxylmethyltransferase family protein [Fervidobacterium sp.]